MKTFGVDAPKVEKANIENSPLKEEAMAINKEDSNKVGSDLSTLSDGNNEDTEDKPETNNGNRKIKRSERIEQLEE